jgi:hypothetical protein
MGDDLAWAKANKRDVHDNAHHYFTVLAKPTVLFEAVTQGTVDYKLCAITHPNIFNDKSQQENLLKFTNKMFDINPSDGATRAGKKKGRWRDEVRGVQLPGESTWQSVHLLLR